jgi:hypothetical protein
MNPLSNILTLNPSTTAMTRALGLILIVAFVLAGCSADDVASGMDETNDTEPLIANARIDIALEEIRVVSKCEGGTNPGEWQFAISFINEGNTPLEDELNLPPGSTFGTSQENTIDFYTVNDGSRINLEHTVSFELSREEGRAFNVQFAGYEWDGVGKPDPDMTNRSVTRSHTFRNGQFTSVVGTNNLRLGFGRCQANLRYTVTVQ